MDEKELEKSIEEKAKALIENNANTEITSLLDEKAKSSDNVKEVIDLLATRTALEKQGTVDKIVDEKSEELRNDAESKRIQAETERVNEEVKKVLAEKEKQIAEYDKEISLKKAEVEKLKTESDRAQVFFESNADILSCIGIKRKKTLKVMCALMIPATVIFVLIRIIALPITVGGKIVEILIDIIGGICKAITNNALRIIIAILVLVLLIGGGFCVYYFGGSFITGSCNG